MGKLTVLLLLVLVVCSVSGGSLRRRIQRQKTLTQVKVRAACTLTDRPGETGECKIQGECPEATGAFWASGGECTAPEGCCLPAAAPTADPTADPHDVNADNDGINGGQDGATLEAPDAKQEAAAAAAAPAEELFGAVMDCRPGDDAAAPAGKCFDSVVSECKDAEFVTGRCPGATSKCCPVPGQVRRKAGRGELYNHGEDMCFPLAEGDFTDSNGERTVTGFITASSFSQNRPTTEGGHTRRCHKGLDMFTGGVAANRMTHGRVVAIAPGRVTSVMTTFTTCRDGWYFDAAGVGARVPGPTAAYGITIHHPSLNMDVTYGELTFAYVKMGDEVVKGRLLGEATVCEMLHFELWGPNTRSTNHWGPDPETNEPCCPTDACVPSLAGLKNPRPLLRMLEGKWCVPVEPSDQAIQHPTRAPH